MILIHPPDYLQSMGDFMSNFSFLFVDDDVNEMMTVMMMFLMIVLIAIIDDNDYDNFEG